MTDADRVLVHYEWAEPGDPTNPNYSSVRAKPLAKPVVYPSVTPEAELDLIRRYHEDGDLDALEQLVGAHRPMVVRMAKSKWRGNGTTLKALVEYGMLGLRFAAEPSRPSLTKKGKMVGFDPSKGNRFSTYSRHYADKEMNAALADDPAAVKPEFAQKATVEVESWGEKTEFNAEADRPSDLSIAPRPDRDYWRSPKYGHDLTLSAPTHRCAYQSSGGAAVSFIKEWLGYAREGMPHLQRRRWHYCSKAQSTLWNPPAWAKDQCQRKVGPRNYVKHPITRTELANRDLYHLVYYLLLRTHEVLAKTGMEGWDDDEEADSDFFLASFFGSPAFNPKTYRLPDEVSRQRWRMGCKRDGKIIPFSLNGGFGLYDRRGHPLPDYTCLHGKFVVIRNRPFTPFLCRFPVASIYLVGWEINGGEGEIISWRRLWTTEHSRCLQRDQRGNSLPCTYHHQSSKPLTLSPNANSAPVRTLSGSRS